LIRRTTCEIRSRTRSFCVPNIFFRRFSIMESLSSGLSPFYAIKKPLRGGSPGGAPDPSRSWSP
jgi:hypothetical protein